MKRVSTLISTQRRTFISSTVNYASNTASISIEAKDARKGINPPAAPQLQAQIGNASPLHKAFFKGGIRRTTNVAKPVVPEEFRHKVRPLSDDWVPQCSNLPPNQEEYAFNVLRICQSQDEPTIWSIWNVIRRRNLENFFRSRTQLRNGLQFLKRNGFISTQTGIYVRCNMTFVVNDAAVHEYFYARTNLERHQKQCHKCKTVFDSPTRESEHLVDPVVWRWSKSTEEMICLACKPNHEEEYANLLEKLQGDSIEVFSNEQL